MAANDVTIKIKIENGEANQVINKLQTNLTNVSQAGQKAGQSIASSFSNLSIVVTGINSALEVTRKIFSFLSQPFEIAANFENLETQLSVLYQSTDTAKAKLQELKEYSDKTPFTLSQLAEAETTLASFGLTAGQTSNVIKQIGDISGGNAEKLKSLALVFGQVSAAGKLQGQDLMQMINVGFNPLRTISQLTGESIEELKTRMEQGGISAQEVAMAFEAATSKGGQFYQMAEKQSKNFIGLVSTLKGVVESMLLELMNAGLFEYVKNMLAGITIFFNENKQTIISVLQSIGGAFANVISIIGGFIDVIMYCLKPITKNKVLFEGLGFVLTKVLIPAITVAVASMYAYITSIKLVTMAKQAWAVIQATLNALLTANPIGIVIVAIGALIAIIAVIIDNTIGLSNAWIYLKGTARMVWEDIKTYFEAMAAGFSLVLQAVKQLISFDFSSAVNTISKIYDTMISKIKEGQQNVKKEYNQMQKELADNQKQQKGSNKKKASNYSEPASSETFEGIGIAGAKNTSVKTAKPKAEKPNIDYAAWEDLNNKLDKMLEEEQRKAEEQRTKQLEEDLKLELERAERYLEQEKEKNEIIYELADEKTKNLIDLENDYNEMRNRINENTILTEEEKFNLLNRLQERYTQKKEELLNREREAEKQKLAGELQNVAASAQAQDLSIKSLSNVIRSKIKMKFAEIIADVIAAAFASSGLLGFIVAPVMAAAAGALFEKLVPKFATGGIVGGNEYSGDKILARVNSGEMILNAQQQANLFSFVSSTNQANAIVANKIDNLANAIKQAELSLNIDGYTASRINLLGNKSLMKDGL